MAAGGYLKIYSNDGATLLFTSTNYYSVTDNMTVTETGVTLANEAYTYSGDNEFLGLSLSANSTELDRAVGFTGTLGDFTYYIVEEEPEEPTVTSQGEIYYNGNLVDTLIEGEFIVLHAKDFKFLGDIVIKNVGEAEEETPTLISFTIDGTSYTAEEGMTWSEFCASEYNTAVGCYDAGYYIYAPSGNVLFDDSGYTNAQAGIDETVTADEIIIANHDYYSATGGFD